MKQKLMRLASATDDNRFVDWLVLAGGALALGGGLVAAVAG